MKKCKMHVDLTNTNQKENNVGRKFTHKLYFLHL